MPFAAFKSVREVSSEDSIHKAENLIKEQTGKKWKTKTNGEKSAYVILELNEPQQITGIDLGNEHSAFIEVLVGNAGCAVDNFKEILLTCSFMTPIESKNSTNINRVRYFHNEALVEDVSAKKWQLIKIVCTQPFNKYVQYGMSFIKLHVTANSNKNDTKVIAKNLVPDKFLQQQRKLSNESIGSAVGGGGGGAGDGCSDETAVSAKNPIALSIGKFMLREESPDSESECTTELFKRWKSTHFSNEDNKMKIGTEKKSAITTAAAIRDASSPGGLRRRLSDSGTKSKLLHKVLATTKIETQTAENELKTTTPTTPTKLLDRNRQRLLFGDDDDEDDNNDNVDVKADVSNKKARLEKHIAVDKERLRLETDKLHKDKVDKEKQKQKQIQIHKYNNKNIIDAVAVAHNDNIPNVKHAHSHMSRKNADADADAVAIAKKRQSSPCDIGGSSNSSSSSSNSNNNKNNRSSTKPIAKKLKSTKTAALKSLEYRPFNQLLKGVVLVISGIQNPDRANLRSKALAMGAKYKMDWDNNCTHLICAFKNTPKYQQVKGHGKIIKRSWIEKCYDLKKYLPWRRYALDSVDIEAEESDVEIFDESLKAQTMEISDDDDDDDDDSAKINISTIREREINKQTVTETEKETETEIDIEKFEENAVMETLLTDKSKNYYVTSDCDTEDEIEKVVQKMKKNSPSNKENKSLTFNKNTNDDDIYDLSTDEEDYMISKKAVDKDNVTSISTLIFDKLNFYIASEIGVIDQIKLKEFIEKFNGHITKTPTKAQYIISDVSLKDEIKDFVGEVVRPNWIFECNNLNVKLPTTRYLV